MQQLFRSTTSLMNPVCPIPGLEQSFPPVVHSHMFPSFAGTAENLPLFPSSCVSASRHPEEHPDTLSGGRGSAMFIG